MRSPLNHFTKFTVVLLTVFFLISCSALKFGNKKEQKVLVQTTEGNIKLKLYNETPLHRDNFIKLVKTKFYDGVLFHRVINEFMIQGGDPQSKTATSDKMLGEGDTGYTIPAEFKTPAIFHKKGALAAARQGDDVNPMKASSGCQFYIVTGKKFSRQQLDALQRSKMQRYGKPSHENDSLYFFSPIALNAYENIGGTPHLDGNYTVFGEVVEGLNVVDKISQATTNADDRPVKDVRIIKMRLVRK